MRKRRTAARPVIAGSLSAPGLGAVPVFADVDPRTLHLTEETIEG